MPGSQGLINPTAVLGGARCCCYLYLLLCSSNKDSQLGLCSRDTEPWLPSKLGLPRALPSRSASRLYSPRRVNGGHYVIEMQTYASHLSDGISLEISLDNVESWDSENSLSVKIKGCFLLVSLPSPEGGTDDIFLHTTVLLKSAPAPFASCPVLSFLFPHDMPRLLQ